MAIPKFQDFLYPFLKELESNELTREEIKAALISHFNLSDEDCSLKTKGGRTTQFNDRINWTIQYLRRALFVEIPKRGTYRITQRGKDYLSQNTSLTQAELLEYPEFKEFAGFTSDEKQPKTQEEVVETNEEQTPTEQLEEAFQIIQDDLATEILQKTLEQTPQFFEKLVIDLLLKMGYGGSSSSAAMVTQYVRDGGIDGIISEDKLGLDKIYIQAKRYNTDNIIGKPQIQQFAGALDERKADKGVFITTSSYSKEARAFVEKASKKIVLIDGKELARYMIEFNVGVSIKQVYEIKRIDSDYFEE